MNWLILIAIAVIFDSMRIFIDNYSSDVFFKGRYAVSQKLFSGYAYVIIFGITLAATGFNFFSADPIPLLLLILSGALSALAGVPYFKALEIDDSTNIGIFIQLAPVFYLILGWFILGDTFLPIQLVAFAVILAAPLFIVLTTKKRSRKVKIRAVFYAFLYVIIAVVGNLLFVKAHEGAIDFVSEIALVHFFSGITNLILVYSIRKWRRRFIAVVKQSRKKVLVPLFASTCARIIQQFSYRGALVAAPAVALASAASDSAEPIVIFFMGLLLTLIWPRFGREKLDKRNVLIHLAATALVVTGIILLQF